MANVAKFDRDEVLAKATWLFWSQGFQATSTRDIQQAVNMRPGSMYAAFGGKADLYRLALENYAGAMTRLLDQHLEDADTIPQGIRAFVTRVLLDTNCDEVADVCLLYRTVAELGEDQAELLACAREHLQRMEMRLVELVEEAKARNELPPEQDSKATAAELQSAILGMRAYLRINGNRTIVQKMIDGLLPES
ncbi:MAG: TetR family transcriptional regulator [Oceanospirillaceae bacterium]|nr:TetR family transcriptional regulator [Oceanospirillaceae bacterium]